MNEFILVEFDERREVIIDENASGYHTGEVIALVPGPHTISLVEPHDFSPMEQDVNPAETSPIKPRTIYFNKA